MGRTQEFRNPNHMLPSTVFGTPDLNLGGHAKCQHQAGERTRARRTPERGTKLNTRPGQPCGSCDQHRHRRKETALGEFLSDPTPPWCCQRQRRLRPHARTLGQSVAKSPILFPAGARWPPGTKPWECAPGSCLGRCPLTRAGWSWPSRRPCARQSHRPAPWGPRPHRS